MLIRELETPAAVVDLDRLERNVWNMARRASELGVTLRPHVKTHKCTAIARLQAEVGCRGFTVSTVAEARHLWEAGFSDLTYAVPLAPVKLPAVLDLVRRGARLRILVDHLGAVAFAEKAARDAGLRLDVLIKVDCGYHRAGVDPESSLALELARRIQFSESLVLAGVLTHAGHSYGVASRAEASEVAIQERDVMVAFARRLEIAGCRVPEISVGATPTFAAVDHLRGVTESRPGNAVFFDVHQAAIGSVAVDDIAMAVSASVVGVYPEQCRAVIDAGSLALSRDPGPVHVNPNCGFGLVCGGDWKPIPGLVVGSLSQEHGAIHGPTATLQRLSIGSTLLILPNHSCLAAACFDRYHMIRGGVVEAVWSTWGRHR